jgi:hypothetical protein
MRIGYARVSRQHRSLDRQIGALRAERVSRQELSGSPRHREPAARRVTGLLRQREGERLWLRAKASCLPG